MEYGCDSSNEGYITKVNHCLISAHKSRWQVKSTEIEGYDFVHAIGLIAEYS